MNEGNAKRRARGQERWLARVVAMSLVLCGSADALCVGKAVRLSPLLYRLSSLPSSSSSSSSMGMMDGYSQTGLKDK